MVKIIEINDCLYKCHKLEKSTYQFNFWITPSDLRPYKWYGGWIIPKNENGKQINIDIWDKNIKGKIGKHTIKSHTIINTNNICETIQVIKLLFFS